jgi:hypothetical protein
LFKYVTFWREFGEGFGGPIAHPSENVGGPIAHPSENVGGPIAHPSVFWREFFCKSFTPPQKVGGPIAHPSENFSPPSRTRPKVFGGKVSRGASKSLADPSAHPSVFFGGILVEFLAGSFHAASKRFLAGSLGESSTQPQKVLAGSLGESFTQPQKV